MHQHLKVKDLVAAAYAAVPTLPPAEAKLMREVTTRLSVTFTALTESLELRKALTKERDELNQQVVNLAVENAQLKQTPANNSERMLLALDAFQTHGKSRPDVGMQQAFNVLRNVVTPATDAAIAQYRAEGINFAASRLCAAYNHGFIDKPLKEVADVVRMILDAKEELFGGPLLATDGLSGEYAEKSLEEYAAQLRKGAAA